MANFSAFGSTMATVASKVVTAKKFRYNLAARNNYATLYYLLAGKPMSAMLRAGSDVRARLLDRATSKAGWYNVSNDDHAPQIDENGVWAIAYWCAHMAQTSYKEEALLVNSGGVTEGSLAEETWTQELWSKIQDLMTNLHGSLSDSFWAQPVKANMAGTDPVQPHSIPAFLNEFTNGLFQETPGTSGTYWTTVNTVDPLVTTRYDSYRASYGAGGAGFTANNVANIIFALAKAMRKTKFEPPPLNKEYFDPESDAAVDSSGGVIFCSSDGLARVEHLYKSSQDRWADAWDPAGNPKFKNTMFVYEAQLDNAVLYPNHATLASATGLCDEAATGASNASAGPRFYGVNAKYMDFYWHRSRFLEFLEPFRESLTGWTQGVNSLGTLLCPDRSKHFYLYPAADQY